MFAESISILAQVQSESDDSGSLFTIVTVIAIALSLIVPLLLSPKRNKGQTDLKKKDSVLTAEDVVNKRFQPTKFREGYSQDMVDDFLDSVITELRGLQEVNSVLQAKAQNPDSAPIPQHLSTLTPNSVVNQKFTPTKFSEGYDQDEVDDFLDRVVVTLRHWVSENERLRTDISGNVQ